MVEPLHHPVDYFDGMYRDRADPWGFDTRWYERRKYDVTVAALPRERYRRAFEPGCANGALTELLAQRCDEIVATDLLHDVADRARIRLRGVAGVDVRAESFPTWWPPGDGDLVVWSEVAYYLTSAGLEVALSRALQWLVDGGDLIAVHYLGETDYPQPGAAIATWLDACELLERTVTHVDQGIRPGFELGVWRRVVRGV